MTDLVGTPRSILISSASIGFANVIADLLRREPGVEHVVVPADAKEMLNVLEETKFDLHLVGGGSIDFHISVRQSALARGRYHESREIALMLNEPDPFRVLVALGWNARRVLDMRLPLDEIARRIVALPGSPLWSEDEISRFRLGPEDDSPTLGDIYRDDIDLAIIQGIIEGLSDPEIAERINFAVQSVRNRVSRILMSSQSRNRTHFAVRMLRSHSKRQTGT